MKGYFACSRTSIREVTTSHLSVVGTPVLELCGYYSSIELWNKRLIHGDSQSSCPVIWYTSGLSRLLITESGNGAASPAKVECDTAAQTIFDVLTVHEDGEII